MPSSKDLTDLDSQLKKTVISAESFRRGSSLDSSKNIANIHKTIGTLAGHTRKLVGRVINLEKTVENNSRKITSLKNLSKTQSERISGTNIGAKLPGGTTTNVEDNISAITKSVSSIAEILSGRKKLLGDATAYDKRKDEQEKRQLAESKLEKRFDGLRKVAEKVIAPVKSILDRIIDFFVTVFLGRVVYKLLEWFGDPKNAEKVNSIIRFLGDHWPKLLSLYLVFGTSFGRFAKGLLKAVLRGTFKLTALIFKLAAAKKLRGAGKIAGFLGGGKGKLLANVAGTALALGGTYAVAQGLKGDGEEQKAQAYHGGGYVKPRFPTFSGGGLNFKGMMGGASMGAMFGPLGMLLGGMFGSGKPQQMISGFVSGEKGVDKVPAMLSDGEFVMSTGAVAKYGVDTLEAMNAAGGGTNKPKIVSGTTYAQGGGLIGETDKEKIKDPILEKRKKEERKSSSSKISEADIRKEWNNVFNDIDHPLYYKAITDESYNYAQFKKEYLAKQSSGYKPYVSRFAGARDAAHERAKRITGASSYKPYVSRFAGARDAAHERASRIRGSREYISPFAPGGMFGGPRMQARTDYAASKGKYYSSSDQKTYGNYNDAMAAKKTRMTSLASQQRLNKLSYEKTPGARYSRGVRFDTESLVRTREDIKRGGVLGQLSRFSTRVFGGERGRARVDAADKASTARVKQAGAASIGRYYSSSDGKYYKDYNAAVQAKKLRMSQQQKKSAPSIKPVPKPKPKYNPAGGGMGGGRGSGSSPSTPRAPKFGATCPKNGNAKAKTLGIR